MRTIGISLTAVGLAVILCACTTTSGTRVQLDSSSLSQVKTLGVYVRAKESFSVYLSRDRMTATGAVIGGLIGASIEAGVRSSEDDKVLQKVRPNLGDFDVQSALATNLEQQLLQTGLFSAVRLLDSADQRTIKAAGADAILEVDVLQWGLLVCSATSLDDRLQAGIVTHARLATVAGDRKLWVNDETHLDGDCHYASEYETKPELLRQLLNRAVEGVAGRAANEIRYPNTSSTRSSQ